MAQDARSVDDEDESEQAPLLATHTHTQNAGLVQVMDSIDQAMDPKNVNRHGIFVNNVDCDVHNSVADEDVVREQEMTFTEALKLYPKAIGWSMFFSLGVIMLAFDPQLLGNLYATPAFQRDFGYEYNGKYIISAPWQSGLSMGNPIGQVVGALFAAYPMELYGRKRTFAVCVLGTCGCVFIQFFARSLPVLLVGELLGGLILGAYVVIAPAYASEVCPIAIRGQLTSYINLCFVIGQLLANGVTAGTSKLNDHWAFSIPFALQWFWILIILPGIPFAPESPWWLARQDRHADALTSLRRLASPKVDTQATLSSILLTNAHEQKLEASSTYLSCFSPPHIRRTEICIGVYATQVLSGIYLINYGTYFFQQAGLSTSKSFSMSIAFLAVGFVGTVLSWFLMLIIGRRKIFNLGLALLALLQLTIGILDCLPSRASDSGIVWAQSSLMLVWNFIYGLSVGPICFVIICECSSPKLRSKTIAIATAVQACLGIGMTVGIPYLINPDQADLRGKLGFVFGGLASLCLLWAWVRVPETGRRTYDELDRLFERGVGAREFEGYVFDDEDDR